MDNATVARTSPDPTTKAVQATRSKPDQSERTARAQMLVQATKVFVRTDAPDEQACAQYREAFYLLIADANLAVRAQVSTMLSRAPRAPRQIALFLAMDAPAVAMPLLRQSQALGDLDLAHIVTRCGDIHKRIVASRPDLPDAIVWTLASNRDGEIATALLANPSITLRADLRAQLEADRSGDGELQPAPAHTSVPARAKLKAALDAKPAPRSKSVLSTSSSTEPVVAFAKRLEDAAYLRDRPGLIATLQDRYGLSRDTCLQVLADHTGDALNVAMKADGIAADRAHRIVLLAITAVGLSPAAARRAMEVYDRLKQDTCERAVDAWPKDTAHRSFRHVAATADAPGVRGGVAERTPAIGQTVGLRRTG